MRVLLVLLSFCLAAPSLLAETPANANAALPREPREFFSNAAPFYNFSDPQLKPWHLKAKYQLYDGQGNPAESGVFEYWWISPTVYRSSWTRSTASQTDWHTTDGKHAYLSSGGRLNFFEFQLQSAFLSPLPSQEDLDPAKVRLDRRPLGAKKDGFQCVMIVPQMHNFGSTQNVPLGLFPSYCFDPVYPALRISFSFGSVTTGFDSLVKFQNRYLAREIQMLEGKRKILTASVDSLTWLDPSNPALIPSSDAHFPKVDKVQVNAGIAVGHLLRKEAPVYPQDAKDAHMSGTVVLRATIGRDGGVHNLHVVSAPWPSLASSALWAVSQWSYKPYLLNGDPVEVETTINVIYTLG